MKSYYVDGINDDGVSGWSLLMADGHLIRCEWHCDYAGSVDRGATIDDIEELITSSSREYPRSLPHVGSYRVAESVAEFDDWLRGMCTGHPPPWFDPDGVAEVTEVE